MQTCRLAYSVTVSLLIFLETWPTVHGNGDSDPSESSTTEKWSFDDPAETSLGKVPNVFWRRVNNGILPPDSVKGGWNWNRDLDNGDLYVGRAWHDGRLIPGMIKPNISACYISYDGKEYAETRYDVLYGGNLKWEETFGPVIPDKAIIGSWDVEPVYIGRVKHQHKVFIGKVSWGTEDGLHVAVNGTERYFRDYEILVSE